MGDQLVVIGWGATVYGGDATDVLQMATVDYIPNEVCKNITGDVNGVPTSMESQVIDVTLCAIDFANGQDACQGDSGGPILIQGSDASEDILVGLTSSGIDGCADGIFPGVYARTSAAARWIDEELCRLSNNPPADFGCPNVTRLPVTSNNNVNVTIEIDL
jgi:trypsin